MVSPSSPTIPALSMHKTTAGPEELYREAVDRMHAVEKSNKFA
jgi:hypothetical protein